MAAATVGYLIASIFIYCANKKSANATNEQVKESKRQFEETQRLQAMPYLEVRIEDCDFRSANEIDEDEGKPHATLRITDSNSDNTMIDLKRIHLINAGTGMLHQTTISWDSPCKNTVLFSGNIIIQPKSEWDFYGYLTAKKVDIEVLSDTFNPQCHLTLEYKDILGHLYRQVATVWFFLTEDYIRLVGYSVTVPELINGNNDITPNRNNG